MHILIPNVYFNILDVVALEDLLDILIHLPKEVLVGDKSWLGGDGLIGAINFFFGHWGYCYGQEKGKVYYLKTIFHGNEAYV